MHPFTTFLTHIAASLTGCGNCRGYAWKAAKERFSKTQSISYRLSIWINLFFLFFVNWNEDLRNGDIFLTNGVSLIWNTTTIIIVELRNELKKLNIDLSMIYKLIFPLVNNIIKLSS